MCDSGGGAERTGGGEFHMVVQSSKDLQAPELQVLYSRLYILDIKLPDLSKLPADESVQIVRLFFRLPNEPMR